MTMTMIQARRDIGSRCGRSKARTTVAASAASASAQDEMGRGHRRSVGHISARCPAPRQVRLKAVNRSSCRRTSRRLSNDSEPIAAAAVPLGAGFDISGRDRTGMEPRFSFRFAGQCVRDPSPRFARRCRCRSSGRWRDRPLSSAWAGRPAGGQSLAVVVDRAAQDQRDGARLFDHGRGPTDFFLRASCSTGRVPKWQVRPLRRFAKRDPAEPAFAFGRCFFAHLASLLERVGGAQQPGQPRRGGSAPAARQPIALPRPNRRRGD